MGFPYQFKCLVPHAMSARLRVCWMSDPATNAWNRIDQCFEEPDFLFASPMKQWYHNSILITLRRNRDLCEAIPGVMQAMIMPKVQSQTYALIMTNMTTSGSLTITGALRNAF